MDLTFEHRIYLRLPFRVGDFTYLIPVPALKSDRYPRGSRWESERKGPSPYRQWELYEIIESVLENSHYGKVCLLRMICEAADVPFNRMHGLAGQLFRVLFTPSTTSDTFRSHADQEYHGAELAGRQNPERCQSIFSECPESLLEYFTEIRE
uniref:Uncharacterized protein n=1 Tax=Vespula pensylvanica TaxID=30213 RepID=A0A834KTJ9_VESPE|nr:hypothetical protein H0235_012627 [Vespula pensylvanica]